MPKATDVYCVHCEQHISRSRERAHRAAHYPPFVPTPPRPPSKLQRVFDIESEDSGSVEQLEVNVEQPLRRCQ